MVLAYRPLALHFFRLDSITLLQTISPFPPLRVLTPSCLCTSPEQLVALSKYAGVRSTRRRCDTLNCASFVAGSAFSWMRSHCLHMRNWTLCFVTASATHGVMYSLPSLLRSLEGHSRHSLLGRTKGFSSTSQSTRHWSWSRDNGVVGPLICIL